MRSRQAIQYVVLCRRRWIFLIKRRKIMNVRKRGLALLMCICMIFTLLPFSAFADGEESYNTHSETGGVVMDKTVTHVSDDTYKVTLEQYVSGSVTPGTTTPIDAVLVLDVSGSMDEGFGEGDAAYVEEYNPEKIQIILITSRMQMEATLE